MADINMTPFIDVMLVLLIIFMVAAPLLATGVAVDLPQTKAGPLNIDQKPLSIAIDDKGQIFLMDQPVEIGKLLDRLKETAKAGFDERIYMRASKTVNYGRVAEIMSLVTTRRLQEGRAGDRVGEEVRARLEALAFRTRPHRLGGGPCRAAAGDALAFSDAKKFEDAQETVPVDIVTDAQINQVMKGEKTAKEIKPVAARRQDRRARTRPSRCRRSPRRRRTLPPRRRR